MAYSPESILSVFGVFTVFLQERDQNYRCTAYQFSCFLIDVEPPIVLVSQGFYIFTLFFGYAFNYSASIYLIQDRFSYSFLIFLFLNIKNFISQRLYKTLQEQTKKIIIGLDMAEKNSQQKLRSLAIKLLMFNLRKKVFNFDEALKFSLKAIKQQIQKEANTKNEDIYEQIKDQMLQLVNQLKNLPDYWLNKILNGQIQQQQNRIKLNSSQTITQIYEDILQNVSKKILQTLKIEQNLRNAHICINYQDYDFQQLYCDESVSNLFAELLNQHAKKILQNFKKGKDYILEQQHLIEKRIKEQKLMNPYLLFGLIKQMSNLTYENIKQSFYNIFPQTPGDIVDKFCRFVQENYQVMELTCSSDEGVIYSQQQKQKIGHQRRMNLITSVLQGFLTQEKIQQMQILVKNQLEIDHQPVIMALIQMNVNKKKKKKGWRTKNIKKSVIGVYKAYQNTILSTIKAQPREKIHSNIMNLGMPAKVSIGGSLGIFLVNINKFKSAGEFFKAFSQGVVVGGTISVLLQEVPILNYIIIAGGLTYTAYVNYKDEITTSMRKMKQIGRASVMAVGAVGSTVTGMIIGQILIPVPFLGAFIGGVVGGYFGQKGSRKATQVLKKNSCQNLIQVLLNTMIQNRRWEFSPELLHSLSINERYFFQNLQVKQYQKDAYITGLCFCIAAHYQFQKHLKKTQQKLQQKQKQEQKQKNSVIQIQMKEINPKQIKQQTKQPEKLQDKIIKKVEIPQENLQIQNNEFNLVLITQYLSQNQFNLLVQLPKLLTAVHHLIA